MTRFYYTCALAAALALAHGQTMASEPLSPVQSTAALPTEAEQILAAAYSSDDPGAAVIVTSGGKVLYQGARGLADLSTGRKIGSDTVFRVGSIAKQFTAAIVLQLAGEGKLSLDDPLSRFFPGWPAPSDQATVRQLLNHTSGVFDFSKIPGFMTSEQARRPNSTAELVAIIRDRPAKAAPGKEWEYNNGGYVLLGAIIEQVTGRAWAEEIERRIARPLGLTSLSDAVSADAHRETAHFYGREGEQFVLASGAHLSVAGGAGNLAMSVGDLAKWAQALHHGRVLTPALYAEMIKPATLSDGTTRPYGMGLRLQRLFGEPALDHGGAARGVDTDSIYLPSHDLFVAVFANSDRLPVDASTVSRRLAAVALGHSYPIFEAVTVPPETVAPLLVSYRDGEGPEIRFFARDGKLAIGSGDDEHEVFAAGQDRFFLGRDSLAWFAFERSESGAPVMVMHEPDEAEPMRAVRIGEAPPPLALPIEVVRGYVGKYSTEVGVVTVALEAQGGLTIAMGAQAPMAMRPTSQTEFRVDSGRFKVEFQPEGGQTERLTMIRGARTLNGVRVPD